MADNYLEKKMEELRSGRLGQSNPAARSVGGRRSGVLQVAFPPRRVLVAGGCNGVGAAIARSYLKTGCKVAVFDNDRETGDILAQKEGIRFYHIDLADAEAVENGFTNLLSAWRDIDIIINASLRSPVKSLADLWCAHRTKYPIPTEYGGRMIILSSDRQIINSSEIINSSMDTLSKFGISVNGITVNSMTAETEKTVTRLCLFLSLPGNQLLDRLQIPVG